MRLDRLRTRYAHHAAPLAHLFGGVGVTALLPIITAPINSRLYDPAAFGVLGLVGAISALTAVPYTFGFARLISLAGSVEEAKAQFEALVATLALPSLVLAAVPVAGTALFDWSTVQVLLFALVCFVLSAFGALSSAWLILTAQFKALSLSRIVQAVATAAISIGLGLAGAGALGIVWGYVLGLAAGSLVLARHIPVFKLRVRGSCAVLAGAVRSNKALFITSLPAEALNTVTGTMPAFMFTAFSGPTFLGLFNMANRLLDLPGSLMSSAFAQYFQTLAIKRNMAGRSLLPLVLSYSLSMLAIGAPFVVIGTIYAPDLAVIVLGEKWRGAGELARYLSIYIFLKIIVSPVTFVIILRRAFIISLVMDIVLVGAVAAGFFVGLSVFRDPYLATLLFTAIYSTSYLISFAFSVRLARRPHAPV